MTIGRPTWETTRSTIANPRAQSPTRTQSRLEPAQNTSRRRRFISKSSAKDNWKTVFDLKSRGIHKF
jgi:hypothetical protein